MLHNAATEPEVVEFALFLKRTGAIAPTQAGPPMLPPRLVRRLVLAPMAIVIAPGVIVLSPLLGLLALLFGLVVRPAPGCHRARSSRVIRAVPAVDSAKVSACSS